ncbi:sulfate reduction electron transfer complex DsrMKJOP subunit DsrP [Desulfonatronovibrio magnus]|uniref:sulfate reduction electron transfer complex DsrMKJOP subunit DsrP n=1 Tax=Desulfonatronovibrio magnus TaxID=698827 RepID=UPI0005EBE62D|nr:NrfD/PsrC family molybdoenzyme membrane anchor subunit [Desulfonatronovibrio magnus]RQD61819.1 MAG: menaquinol oxidoreductase [Desulfonatronovibrio sp. MSAO_Bac4]
MLEKAIKGNILYWGWIFFLLAIIGVGAGAYLMQLEHGLGITGLNRDVSWGFYIAQFTFLVGVAASAVMMVIPKYLHNFKAFGRMLILGEFLAIAAVSMCLMFIIVDLGQPARLMNVILHPSPNSILFWDMIVLNGYLFLNLLIGWVTLQSERKQVAPPRWIMPFIYLSIPWAVSIHTVTAFLYAGLPGRDFWLTAVMAPSFLASAFAAGPALLILLGLIVKAFAKWDPGKESIQALAKIVVYAMSVHLFIVLCKVFTAAYSQIPDKLYHYKFLYFGLDGHTTLATFSWVAIFAGIVAVIILLNPKNRQAENVLAFSCILILMSTWIDKGLGLISAGFIPNPMKEVVIYTPTQPELLITLAIWAKGFLILTILYKVAIGVKKEIEV